MYEYKTVSGEWEYKLYLNKDWEYVSQTYNTLTYEWDYILRKPTRSQTIVNLY